MEVSVVDFHLDMAHFQFATRNIGGCVIMDMLFREILVGFGHRSQEYGWDNSNGDVGHGIDDSSHCECDLRLDLSHRIVIAPPRTPKTSPMKNPKMSTLLFPYWLSG